MKRTNKGSRHAIMEMISARWVILPLYLAMLGCAWSQVAAPIFSPGGGKTSVGFDVNVSCATAGITIRYTTNGAIPTTNDRVVSNGSPVAIQRSLTLKAKAWLGAGSSVVTSADYTVVGDIAAGGYHSLVVKSNEFAHAWGGQQYGALGNGYGTATNRLITGSIMTYYNQPLRDAADCAAGLRHSLALTSSGRVWAFGLNTSGQLGNNTITTPSNYYPVWVTTSPQSELLDNCVQVSAADTYSAALHDGGNVYTWGANVSGRLGRLLNGSDDRYAKVVKTTAASTLDNIRQISAGKNHMLARTPSSAEEVGGQGGVWVWGNNDSGQLGLGNTSGSSRATQATLLNNITDISAGNEHSAVVKWNGSNQGRVYCFGNREFGRLGNGSTVAGIISSPTAVIRWDGAPLENIIAVAAGPGHTLALDTAGTVWAWGLNASGELGDGSLSSRGRANRVDNEDGTGFLSNIVNIAVGGTEGGAFSLASTADGRVYSWGANSNGQLGLGDTTLRKRPKEVATIRLTNAGPPTVTLTKTMPNNVEPATITFKAAVVDADGPSDVASVAFYNGSDFLGMGSRYSDTIAEYSFSWSNAHAGSHTITAVATDLSGTQGSSSTALTVLSYVSVLTISSLVGEDGLSQGVFRISRNTINSFPLSVNFTFGGTAIAGQDFQGIPLSAQIPANQASIDVIIVAINDGLEEAIEDVVISISSGTGYGMGTLSMSAVASITKITNLTDISVFYDGDGLSLAQEEALGTSPFVGDTDGDTVPDNLDAFPLDPTRSSLPVGVSGDTTSPQITLTHPANAVAN